MHHFLHNLAVFCLLGVLRLQAAEFQVSTNFVHDQEHVSIAQLSSGNIVIAWEDEFSGTSEIFFRRYDSNLAPVGSAVRAHDAVFPDQAEPAVAALENGFVIVWCGRGSDANGYGVRFRRFDASGNAVESGPQQVNTTFAESQVRAHVAALTSGGFVVVWDDLSGADQDVRYRRFAANGTPLDPVDLVANGWGIDARLAGDQGNARVAALTNGGFVIVYEDRQSDDVYAVRFDGAGNPLGAPGLASGARQLRVNQQALHEQTRPDVAAFTNGSFVVVFNSETNGTPATRRVISRYFTAAGAASNEVVLGSFTNRTQDPRVAALANGTFAAAMQSMNPIPGAGSNTWSVLVQRGATNGPLLTPSFIAHSHQPDDQDRPAIAALRDGSYVVAWQSFGQDSDRFGVYAQRFTMAGEPSRGRLLIARANPAGTNFLITFTNGSPYVPYRLQAATNLTNWATLQTTNTSNGVFQYTETQGGTLRSRAYRVVTP